MYTQKNRKKTRNTRKNTYQTGGDFPDANAGVKIGLSGTFALAAIVGMVLMFIKNGAHVNPKFL